MGLFSNRVPPNLPRAPETYETQYFNQFANILTLFLQQISAVQQVNVAKLNIDIKTLPTEADLSTLRVGDVYRDSTAGNVLKVKV